MTRMPGNNTSLRKKHPLESVPQVKQLITVGSQASFLYEIGALVSLEYPNPLPD